MNQSTSGCTRIWRPVLLATIVTLHLNAVAQSPQDIIDAIQGRVDPTAEMDINGDNTVDSLDLVRLLRIGGLPDELTGYTWIVAATFAADTGNPVPYSYLFALKFANEDGTPCAETTAIRGFDPTVGILSQKISSRGEIPGQNRPAYLLDAKLPETLEFDYAEFVGGSVVTLASDTVPTPVGAGNPSGVPLSSRWLIELDTSAIINADFGHGAITEEITGFLPDGQPVIATGKVTLAPFASLDLQPIE